MKSEILYFFYDLETGGLDHKTSGIHQISGYIVKGREILEQFNFRLNPPANKTMDAKALKVSRTEPEDLADFPSYGVVFQELLDLMGKYVNPYDKTQKFFEVGYNNASFDSPFLRQFWTDNGNKFFGAWFWSDVIDVRVLAVDELREVRHTMENFKLPTVAMMYGIHIDEGRLHDAMYDIELTYLLYNIIQETKSPRHPDGNEVILSLNLSDGGITAASLVHYSQRLTKPLVLFDGETFAPCNEAHLERMKDNSKNYLIVN